LGTDEKARAPLIQQRRIDRDSLTADFSFNGWRELKQIKNINVLIYALSKRD